MSSFSAAGSTSSSEANTAPPPMRARQLVQAPARARLAAALNDAVRSAEDPRIVAIPHPQVPVAGPPVRACAAELRDLARALADPHPRARGVVLARDLLTDGNSPLYPGATADQLRSRILTARAAL